MPRRREIGVPTLISTRRRASTLGSLIVIGVQSIFYHHRRTPVCFSESDLASTLEDDEVKRKPAGQRKRPDAVGIQFVGTGIGKALGWRASDGSRDGAGEVAGTIKIAYFHRVVRLKVGNQLRWEVFPDREGRSKLRST